MEELTTNEDTENTTTKDNPNTRIFTLTLVLVAFLVGGVGGYFIGNSTASDEDSDNTDAVVEESLDSADEELVNEEIPSVEEQADESSIVSEIGKLTINKAVLSNDYSGYTNEPGPECEGDEMCGGGTYGSGAVLLRVEYTIENTSNVAQTYGYYDLQYLKNNNKTSGITSNPDILLLDGVLYEGTFRSVTLQPGESQNLVALYGDYDSQQMTQFTLVWNNENFENGKLIENIELTPKFE